MVDYSLEGSTIKGEKPNGYNMDRGKEILRGSEISPKEAWQGTSFLNVVVRRQRARGGGWRRGEGLKLGITTVNFGVDSLLKLTCITYQDSTRVGETKVDNRGAISGPARSLLQEDSIFLGGARNRYPGRGRSHGRKKIDLEFHHSMVLFRLSLKKELCSEVLTTG